MCGRYAMEVEPENLAQVLETEHGIDVESSTGTTPQYQPSYNFAPTCVCPVYLSSGEIKSLSWGQPEMMHTFNARSDSLTKPLWKPMKHCMVPIRGYFEWDHNKIPFYIKRKDEKLIFLCGVYNEHGFAIVTTEAPKELAWLHSRMPVVMEPGTQQWNDWLKKTTVLTTTADGLKWYKVDKKVGNVKNDSKQLVQPLTDVIGRFFKVVKRPREESGNEPLSESKQIDLRYEEESPKHNVPKRAKMESL